MRKRVSTRSVIASLSSTTQACGKALLKTGLGRLGIKLPIRWYALPCFNHLFDVGRKASARQQGLCDG